MTLVILTYLAGVLTILSPCILPVLPFVFSKSQGTFLKSRLPLLAGMSLTFSLFSAIAIVGGEWIGRANEIGRIVAMVLMAFFGVMLIFPALADRMLAPLTRLGGKIGGSSPPQKETVLNSFVIGISTGLLWAPCAGPILGLVLTSSAAQGNTGTSIGLLLSYSLGAATSLSLALVAGNKFLGTLKKFLGVDRVVKRVLGIFVLLGVIAIAFNLDRTVLTRLSNAGTSGFENKLLALAGLQTVEKPKDLSKIEGPMPEFVGNETWINSSALSKADLRGKVVLFDFWTYSCINCIRTLPYIKTWAARYAADGLVVIGVHTPEFAFEKSLSNVQKAVVDLDIKYPVVIDNDFKIWNAFKNKYWPANFFVDRNGNIRFHHFGEGGYEENEKLLRTLLMEGRSTVIAAASVKHMEGVSASGVESRASGLAKSPETYLGYMRAKGFASTPFARDAVGTYTIGALKLNQWGFSGAWRVERERAVSGAGAGVGSGASASKIHYRFRARDIHLVLGNSSAPVKFRVTLDGKAPGAAHGLDIDAEGNGVINGNRLYQLIRQDDSNAEAEHDFVIEFFGDGAEAYAFTFG